MNRNDLARVMASLRQKVWLAPLGHDIELWAVEGPFGTHPVRKQANPGLCAASSGGARESRAGRWRLTNDSSDSFDMPRSGWIRMIAPWRCSRNVGACVALLL